MSFRNEVQQTGENLHYLHEWSLNISKSVEDELPGALCVEGLACRWDLSAKKEDGPRLVRG